MHSIISPKDEAIRQALRHEGERLQMPDGLAERVMAQIHAESLRKRKRTSIIRMWLIAVAAAVLLATLIVIVPRIKEGREMVLYEGSYVEIDGKRVDDYRLIKADIHEALSMADQAESFAQ